jgi:hypothetical protein
MYAMMFASPRVDDMQVAWRKGEEGGRATVGESLAGSAYVIATPSPPSLSPLPSRLPSAMPYQDPVIVPARSLGLNRLGFLHTTANGDVDGLTLTHGLTRDFTKKEKMKNILDEL